MKKVFAFLLCGILAISLLGCGKQDDPTTAVPTNAPATEAPTTKAPETKAPATEAPTTTQAPTTEAPTTEAPTTEAPTTEAPTTEAPTTEAPRVENAEDVFRAILNNIADMAEAVSDPESGKQIQLTASGVAKVAAKLTMAASESTSAMEIPISLSGRAEGLADSKKGAFADVTYETNLAALMSLIGAGQGGNSEGAEKQSMSFYADLDTKRLYEFNSKDETWYYSELAFNPEPLNIDREEMNQVSPEMFYEKYDFNASADGYVFNGNLNMKLLNSAGGDIVSELQKYGLNPEDLVFNARLEADKDMQLTAILLSLSPFQLDLSSAGISGLGIALDEMSVELKLDYSPVEYKLPDKVKNNAIEKPVSPDTPGSKVYPVSDLVLIDDERVSVTVTKVEKDMFGDVNVYLSSTNKTADKKLSVSLQKVLLNGYLVDPYWSETLEAGKSSESDFFISGDIMAQIGIQDPDELLLTLRVSDADDWFADPFSEETYGVYPTGLTKEEVVYPERRTGAKELVAVDNDQFSFIILEAGRGEYYGFSVQAFVENKTDKNLYFDWDDVKVNGAEIEPYFSTRIAGGTKGYVNIFFSDTAFETNKITKVENIQFTLRVYDADDWSADDLLKQEFTYEP